MSRRRAHGRRADPARRRPAIAGRSRSSTGATRARCSGIALRRIGDRGRAEDATQDTFASVWRSAPLRPLARRGDVVALHGRAERDRRRPATHAEPAVDDRRSVRRPEPGPADAAEAEWVAWRVHRALETLPEQERSLIELAYWSGLSQSEIADYVNVPLGTVKTRTRSRARAASRTSSMGSSDEGSPRADRRRRRARRARASAARPRAARRRSARRPSSRPSSRRLRSRRARG